MTNRNFGKIMLALYVVVFIVCAFKPYDRGVWYAENLPIVLLVGLIIFLARHHNFSKTSFLLMTVLPILHTIGGHFTFSRVPFDFITDTFDFERNHYDRIAHFSVGFYAYPIAEFILAKGLTRNVLFACVFGVACIFSVASLYEIFEWQFSIRAEEQAGDAVLGSQGDIWDAQKDMLADGLGAMLAATYYFVTNVAKNR